MSLQTAEYVITKRTYTPHEVRDKYMLRPERGWVWAQKAALWVLRRLGCYALVDQLNVQHFTIDKQRFIEQVMAQRSDLWRTYHLNGARVLVGHDEYDKLLGEVSDIHRPLSFTASYLYNGQLEGLRVVLVPWMKGIVVMPKLEGE